MFLLASVKEDNAFFKGKHIRINTAYRRFDKRSYFNIDVRLSREEARTLLLSLKKALRTIDRSRD